MPGDERADTSGRWRHSASQFEKRMSDLKCIAVLQPGSTVYDRIKKQFENENRC
jgi:hypothetical protein